MQFIRDLSLSVATILALAIFQRSIGRQSDFVAGFAYRYFSYKIQKLLSPTLVKAFIVSSAQRVGYIGRTCMLSCRNSGARPHAVSLSEQICICTRSVILRYATSPIFVHTKCSASRLGLVACTTQVSGENGVPSTTVVFMCHTKLCKASVHWHDPGIFAARRSHRASFLWRMGGKAGSGYSSGAKRMR